MPVFDTFRSQLWCLPVDLFWNGAFADVRDLALTPMTGVHTKAGNTTGNRLRGPRAQRSGGLGAAEATEETQR